MARTSSLEKKQLCVAVTRINKLEVPVLVVVQSQRMPDNVGRIFNECLPKLVTHIAAFI